MFQAISPEECSVLLENSLERYGKFVVMLLNYTNIDKPENYMTIDDLPKALDDSEFLDLYKMCENLSMKWKESLEYNKHTLN